MRIRPSFVGWYAVVVKFFLQICVWILASYWSNRSNLKNLFLDLRCMGCLFLMLGARCQNVRYDCVRILASYLNLRHCLLVLWRHLWWWEIGLRPLLATLLWSRHLSSPICQWGIWLVVLEWLQKVCHLALRWIQRINNSLLPALQWSFTLPYLTLPCLALPCLALPCLALPYLKIVTIITDWVVAFLKYHLPSKYYLPSNYHQMTFMSELHVYKQNT